MPEQLDGYVLSEEEATVIARALIVANRWFLAEFEKIQKTPEVSELLISAATDQYNALTGDMTKLHTQLATAFPALRQV